MSLLASMTVSFGIDLSVLKSGIVEAKSLLSDIGATATSSSETLNSLNSANLSELIGAVNEVTTAIHSLSFDVAETTDAVNEAAASNESAFANMADDIVSELGGIKEQLESIPAEAEESAAQSQDAFSGFSLGGMIQSVGMGIFAFQNIANMSTQVATSLLQPAENAENMQASFTNLTGSASAATSELNKLDTFASKTQFTTLNIDGFGADLLGVGTKASSIIPDIQAVGDNLSAVGKGTPAEVQSVIDIFDKMSTQGKITTVDLNELGNHGIKALQDIASGAGLSTDEISKMIKNGTLPASQAIDDLTKGIESNPIYAGGMAKQSGTLSGIMSTLSSDWDVFMSKIMSPALPMLEDGLGKLTTLLTNPSFQQFATEVGVGMVNGIKTFATDIGDLVSTGENIVAFFQHNQTAMDALVAVLISGAGVIGGVLIPLLIGWAVAQWAVAAPVIATAAPFILLGLVVAGVVFGIIEAVQHAGDIAHWFQGIWGDVASFWQDDVAKPFQDGITAVEHAFSGFEEIAGAIWNGIAGGFKSGINDIIGGIDNFIGFIDSIQIHIPSVGVGPFHTPAFDWNGLGIPKIPMLSTGGIVPPGQFAIAGDPGPSSELVFGGTSGASVLSHAQSVAALAGGSGGGASGQSEIHIHIHMNSEEIAHYTAEPTAEKVIAKLFGHGPVRSAA